jgi:hypothetical protein
MTPRELLLQQVVELYQRIAQLSHKGKWQLGELTSAEVGLINYTLGHFSGQLIEELQPPRRMRRSRKKAQAVE